MSRLEKYTPCLRIGVAHDYYRACPPLSLVPDVETQRFFIGSGWVFRSLGAGRWLLLRPDGAAEDISVAFNIMPSDPLFYYVTQSAETIGGSIDIVRQPGTWGVLTARVVRGTAAEVSLRFLPPQKRLEFVLIPRHTDSSATVSLRELRDRVEFLPPEEVALEGVGPVRRIVSREKITLSESSGHRFQLWEMRHSGERLLADRVPSPRPDESSLIEPGDAITTYFYY